MPLTYFCIVGPNDASIYECGRLTEAVPAPGAATAAAAASPSTPTAAAGGAPDTSLHVARQFMLYSALDSMDESMWTKGDCYLSKIDKFDDRFHVSAYTAFAPVKLLLMQDQEPHDNVRPFFQETYELVVRYLMNPFASPTQPIRSKAFEDRIAAIYARFF